MSDEEKQAQQSEESKTEEGNTPQPSSEVSAEDSSVNADTDQEVAEDNKNGAKTKALPDKKSKADEAGADEATVQVDREDGSQASFRGED